jgi:hypothetical protein
LNALREKSRVRPDILIDAGAIQWSEIWLAVFDSNDSRVGSCRSGDPASWQGRRQRPSAVSIEEFDFRLGKKAALKNTRRGVDRVYAVAKKLAEVHNEPRGARVGSMHIRQSTMGLAIQTGSRRI